nr:MAG TPA: RUBREDOXIN TRANSPORT, RUBREDOXIN, GUILLARDIA THETA [Caudoviricetes sp.]DAT69727.1 MAG TPA: RUBREDOXIN TRANSPORT, RUBREDOXIN, GUILLARDIA THETA [Caudoviricetes sp.]
MNKIWENVDAEKITLDPYYLESHILHLTTLPDREGFAKDFTVSQQYKAVWFLDWNFQNTHRRVGMLDFSKGYARTLWTEDYTYSMGSEKRIFGATVKPMYNTFLDVVDLVKEDHRRSDIVMDCQECQYYEYGSLFWNCDTCAHKKDSFCDILKEKSGFCGVFKEENIVCPNYTPSKKDNKDFWKGSEYHKKYLLDCEFACDEHHEYCKLYSELNKNMLCCSKTPYDTWVNGYTRIYPEPMVHNDVVYAVLKKKNILSGDFSKVYIGRIDFYEKTMVNGDWKYRKFDLEEPELVTANTLEEQVAEYKKQLKLDRFYPIIRKPKKSWA